MKIIFTWAITVIFLSGCVSTQNLPVDVQSLEMSSPTTITTTSREKPDFAAMTAGKASFALVGAVAMISAGNKIVEENNVEDPANYIGRELLTVLKEHLSLEYLDNGNIAVDSNKAEEISKTYLDADLVLDVQTVNWSFGYFPTDWNNYRVMYSAKIRLVDTRKRVIVAEGFCARVPDKDDNSPSHEELLAQQASRLKNELQIAAEYCIQEFREKVLKL